MKSYNKIMEDLDLYEELDSETQANDISNLPFSLDSWIFCAIQYGFFYWRNFFISTILHINYFLIDLFQYCTMTLLPPAPILKSNKKITFRKFSVFQEFLAFTTLSTKNLALFVVLCEIFT